MELTVIKDALRKVENDIRNNALGANIQYTPTIAGQGSAGGNWSKSAMEHKAIMNIRELGK